METPFNSGWNYLLARTIFVNATEGNFLRPKKLKTKYFQDIMIFLE